VSAGGESFPIFLRAALRQGMRAGRVAGIGGEMAEILVGTVDAKKAGGKGANRIVPWPDKRSGKSAAGSGAGDPGEKREGEKTEGPAAAGAGPEKRIRGNGLERLEKAADRRLGQASEALANLLLEKATKGKVDSARLLVTLAEHRLKRKPKEKKKKKRPGPSWAELLGSEPEFVAPEVGDVWVGGGWRKPTGEFVDEDAQVGDNEEEGEKDSGPGGRG